MQRNIENFIATLTGNKLQRYETTTYFLIEILKKNLFAHLLPSFEFVTLIVIFRSKSYKNKLRHKKDSFFL